MQAPEPGEMMRELLAKKQALQMELRQRAATGSSMYYGSRLAISLLTKRGAARVALAAGPGLLVMCSKLGIIYSKKSCAILINAK